MPLQVWRARNLTFCWKPSLYEIWHERSLWAGAASQSQLISKFDFPFKFGIGYHVMRQRPRDVTLYRKSHVMWHLTARVLVMLSGNSNVTWHWVSYKIENLTKIWIRRHTSKWEDWMISHQNFCAVKISMIKSEDYSSLFISSRTSPSRISILAMIS